MAWPSLPDHPPACQTLRVRCPGHTVQFMRFGHGEYVERPTQRGRCQEGNREVVACAKRHAQAPPGASGGPWSPSPPFLKVAPISSVWAGREHSQRRGAPSHRGQRRSPDRAGLPRTEVARASSQTSAPLTAARRPTGAGQPCPSPRASHPSRERTAAVRQASSGPRRR
jgi:hypothetical protein